MTGCVAILLLTSLAWQSEPNRLTPPWTVGQELVYRGTIVETSLGQGVQFTKQYRLEARALVLDQASPSTWSLAAFTRLTQVATGDQPEAHSFRLESGTINELGQFHPRPARRSLVDFEGPDSWEAGYLLELPRKSQRLGSEWRLNSPDEPPRILQLAGIDIHGGVPCVKLVQTQQAEEWTKPRGDRAAWKVETIFWVHSKLGLVQRVQRTQWGRPAAHREPTYKLVTTYDLESQLTYEGQFFADRKREVEQYASFHEQLRNLVAKGPRTQTQAYATLGERLDQFLKQKTATPYREVLLSLRQQILAAEHNQLPAPVQTATSAPNRARLAVGQPAPNFSVRGAEDAEPITLKQFRGRPALFVFIHPKSAANPTMLRALQELWAAQGKQPLLQIVGWSMADDGPAAAACTRQHGLTFPVQVGTALRAPYEVQATPYWVLLDAEGTVTAVRTGWGPESLGDLQVEVGRILTRQPEPRRSR